MVEREKKNLNKKTLVISGMKKSAKREKKNKKNNQLYLKNQ